MTLQAYPEEAWSLEFFDQQLRPISTDSINKNKNSKYGVFTAFFFRLFFFLTQLA